MNNSTVDMVSKNAFKKLDIAGVICSGACALHCLLVPSLIFLLPTLGSYLEGEWIHVGLILLLLPIGAVSFFKQKKNHGHDSPSLIAAFGFFYILTPVFAEQVLHVHIKELEVALSLLGSCLLIFAHVQNINHLVKHSKDQE